MPYQELRYIGHARKRMAQRKISEGQVGRAVNMPDRVSADPEVPGRFVAEYDTSAGNFIRVVYAEEHSEGRTIALIITAIRITP